MNATEDNLMPGGGAPWLPTEDPEVRSERETEKANVFNALPLVEEMLTHFDEQIAYYGSVDSVPEEFKADKEKFLAVHNGNEHARNVLRAEKLWLEGLLEQHVR